ncbi:S49 family peptidase [Lacihabitans soyangensis]|uniref:S49 family peptidase n=1 Tax=Lacihabitans soyangensis TaxID=869394 RepID=A0AAE3H589_9BACT|nr:S49 family peptidase [Lacihabitans soyangensis]MCP9765148.1 S49 family peptidase [Lacihabitans soyangensis]
MIEQLISKTWALEPRFNEVQAALMLRKLSQGGSMAEMKAAWDEQKAKHGPYLAPSNFGSAQSPVASHIGADGKWKPWDLSQAKGGGVAIIPMIGTMTRYGGMCSYGSEDFASWIMEANSMDYVSSIVLEMNGPGGEVDGTEMLGAVVKNSRKPVVAYVAGMAASAHYWVASQCREIIMESETTSEVGSIGVLSMHVDASKFYEKEGYKINIIRSDGSEDKALYNSIEPLSAELLSTVKAELNVVRGTFIKNVKAGRPGISDDVFTGKMYFGKEAIKKGMADSIGYLGDAVYRADLLASKSA